MKMENVQRQLDIREKSEAVEVKIDMWAKIYSP